MKKHLGRVTRPLLLAEEDFADALVRGKYEVGFGVGNLLRAVAPWKRPFTPHADALDSSLEKFS